MNIVVFAGSMSGGSPEYVKGARELGEWIAKTGNTLVYGAGKEGMMGAVCEGALSAGGKVVGIIPQFMVDKGWFNPNVTEAIFTDDMSERKNNMYEMGDAFVALPGGAGTLDEIAEAVMWLSLESFDKPVVLYNINGFYNELFEIYKTMVRDDFLIPGALDYIYLVNDVNDFEKGLRGTHTE